jgi:ABC-type Fe3+/spermidine/putrescine transport system ATPase subunit
LQITLSCRDLSKRYRGQDNYALGDESSGVCFDVGEGELFALLGPSGCGKTTTLRIVGGFIEPTAGTVEIRGEDVTNREPYRRPTNTVFQSYALFPHRNVADNVGFGLRMSRVARAEREQRVASALEMVGLDGFAKRKVGELSGGQAQRAALARAMVNRPAVLLLDEPLGALDLKLRKQMQDELARLKRETQTSFVHVTHDQEEACAIADRIAIMDAGRIVQVDTPVALYRHPATAYVAEFLSAGTVIRGRSTRQGETVELEHADLLLRGPAPSTSVNGAPLAGVLPPDRIKLAVGGAEMPAEPGRQARGLVERTTFTGSIFDCHVRIGDDLALKASLTDAEIGALGGLPEAGTQVVASWDPADIIFVHDDHDDRAE